MRFSLRWRILLFTVLPLVFLTTATLWIVNRNVSLQVYSSIQQNLRGSARVFEHRLEGRAQTLATAAGILVQDPRFASLLSFRAAKDDVHYRATIGAVAREFGAATECDLFEVLDRDGAVLASVGGASSSKGGRKALVRAALGGRTASGILMERGAEYQLAATPVHSGGRLVGVLLLGAEIGQGLAGELRTLTRSEVTFVSKGKIIGSSIENLEARRNLVASISSLDGRGGRGELGMIETRNGTQTYLTLVRRIPPSTEGAQLYVLQRSLDAETAFLREIQMRLLHLGIAAAVASLLAGLLLAERITRPIQRLVRGAEEMERGNYEYSMGKFERDEIGHLAERFVEMRRHERAYVNRLRENARIKSEFISVASHELSTPISIIKGYYELIADGTLGPVPGHVRVALGEIGQGLESLIRVADGATRMAHAEEAQPVESSEEPGVGEVIKQAVATARAELPDRYVTVRTTIEDGLAPIGLDRARTALAIVNLVRDGIRSTRDGGHVHVTARKLRDQLMIEVKDEGEGLAEEALAQVIGGASGVENQRSSVQVMDQGPEDTRSAFAATRVLVLEQGGSITVESQPGKGTRYEILLPYVELSKAA